jgi:hypothetical protein
VVATILLCIVPQFFDLKNALINYYRADGDPLPFILQYQKDPIAYIISRVTSNLQIQVNSLLGITTRAVHWDDMVVETFYKANELYYPRFLVPFFVFGFFHSLYGFFRDGKKREGAIFLFFLASLVPGLMSGGGNANSARDYLMALPLYYYIGLAFYFLLQSAKKAGSEFFPFRRKFPNFNITQIFLAALLCFTFLYANAFQISNYFSYKNRQTNDPYNATIRNVYDYIDRKIAGANDASFLFYYPTRILGSYVTLRFINPEKTSAFVKSQRLFFHYGYAVKRNLDLMKSGKIKYLLTLPLFKDEMMKWYELKESQIFYQDRSIIVFSARQ